MTGADVALGADGSAVSGLIRVTNHYAKNLVGAENSERMRVGFGVEPWWYRFVSESV